MTNYSLMYFDSLLETHENPHVRNLKCRRAG
jgi:hypothetical protein